MTQQFGRLKPFFLIMIACVGLAACGQAAPDDQAATPQAPEEGLPFPAQAVTATPAPPLDPAAEAYADLRNGAWEDAASGFQLLADRPDLPPQERAEALWLTARAELRAGLFAAARATLDTLIAGYPEDQYFGPAHFLRGDAWSGMSEWSNAINDYQAYLSLEPGKVDSYVYERIADAYLALGQTDLALQNYELATGERRYPLGRLLLREKTATVYRSASQYDAAVAQYRTILSTAEAPSYRATIEFYIAQTLFEAGRLDQGYEQLNTVFMTYPESYEAFSALVSLLEADYSVDPFQRGLVNYNQANYGPAINAFYTFIAASPIDYLPDAHLYIARSYRQVGNLQAAQTEVDSLIQRFNLDDGQAWGDAWLEKASIQAETGDIEGAFTTLDQFIETYTFLPQRPAAIAQAGQLAEAQGDSQRALAYFSLLAAEYPEDAAVGGLLFELGLAAYRAGDFSGAQGIFNELAQRETNLRQAGYLWLGKSLEASGRSQEAAAAYQAAGQAGSAQAFPALRAAHRLEQRPPFTPTEGFSLPDDPDTGRQEAEQWLVQRFGLQQQPPLADTLDATVAEDPRVVQAVTLYQLGLTAEARLTIDEVRTVYADDPLISYQLAIYLRDLGLYRPSIGAAANVLRLAQANALEAPSFLARLSYPVYYADLIVPLAQQNNLDPLYVFSLVRQESLFDGTAVSSAAAQGLMQIWPPTGQDIAGRLSWPDYQTADLQRPYVSVTFGTWLLQEELSRLNNDPAAALAAYNAGPSNAATWQAAAGGDLDLFVQVITLDEPRLYVTRIYENYAVYQALYGITSSPDAAN